MAPLLLFLVNILHQKNELLHGELIAMELVELLDDVLDILLLASRCVQELRLGNNPVLVYVKNTEHLLKNVLWSYLRDDFDMLRLVIISLESLHVLHWTF